jgi:hypothetical protein
MREHRWSGWPGAFCLNCGQDDTTEAALACDDCYVPCCDEEMAADPVDRFCAEHAPTECPCPEEAHDRAR